MEKKIILRLFFVSLFFIFLILVFFSSNNKKQIAENETTKIDDTIESSNIIQDVNYSSKDTRGNEYNLKAAEGIIDQKQDNIIFLTTVKGIINLNDYNLIEISSDFGKYNINNYDTIFSENVMINYLDYSIKGENLDFSWDRNLMIISKNVSLENDKSSLKADVIEINIKTKDAKIFMYEDNKKVKIKSLN
tara:strand:+ start:967 stop:1539 length:573 start_codon:yes stop_codon:yes gene_type:complete